MRSMLFVVASLALLAYCACAPAEEVIEHIPPKHEPTPSATGKEDAKSGAGDVVAAADTKSTNTRTRREVGGLESDLLPAAKDVDSSPFGETSQFEGRSRIRVLPAFLG